MECENQTTVLSSPLIQIRENIDEVCTQRHGIDKDEVSEEVKRQLWLAGAYCRFEPFDVLRTGYISDVSGSSGRVGSLWCFNGYFLCIRHWFKLSGMFSSQFHLYFCNRYTKTFSLDFYEYR